MNNPYLNPAALLDLAVDPKTIHYLLNEARKAIEETPDDPGLRHFLPAFNRARESLAPTTRYFEPTTGAEWIPDRAGLTAAVDESERAVVAALNAQR